MAETPPLIRVEVAYALPERQEIVALDVPRGTTARRAAELSGIDRLFPGLDLSTAEMGIFSKLLDGKVLPLPEDYVLEERDRVEIYRPLVLDPKEARLRRARKKSGKKG